MSRARRLWSRSRSSTALANSDVVVSTPPLITVPSRETISASVSERPLISAVWGREEARPCGRVDLCRRVLVWRLGEVAGQEPGPVVLVDGLVPRRERPLVADR